MWCPNCKSEYRDGFTYCSDCGAPLVSRNPASTAASGPLQTLKHPHLLATEADAPDLDALLSLLRQSNIPAYIKEDLLLYNLPVNYRGEGVRRGICVEESHLSYAKMLLANSVADWEPCCPDEQDIEAGLPESGDSDEDFTEDGYSESYVRRSRILTKVILCFSIGIPLAFIMYLFYYIN